MQKWNLKWAAICTTTKWSHEPEVLPTGFQYSYIRINHLPLYKASFLICLGGLNICGRCIVWLVVFMRVDWKKKGLVLANEAWNRGRMNLRSEKLRNSWFILVRWSDLADSKCSWMEWSYFSLLRALPLSCSVMLLFEWKTVFCHSCSWIYQYGQVIKNKS